MRVAGIIAEYNPMHNGHIYHLEKSREISKADFVVAVISGNFTQRGEPALLDKWTRSRIAVENGADLVLEMPFVFATGSAETFARGGVGILEGLGIVDALCFGSESADCSELQFMADFLKNESPEFRMYLKKHLDMGISFPKARELAVNECLGMDAGKLLKNPNDILAIEYLKQIRSMTPVAIERKGSYSSEKLPEDQLLQATYPSAMAIRKAVFCGELPEVEQFVPKGTFEELRVLFDMGGGFTAPTEKNKLMNYYDLLRSSILSSDAPELAQIEGVTEGMENRIKKEVRLHSDMDSFADALKSKRFTRTAINRMLIHILTGLKNPVPIGSDSLYTKVLAFNDNGSKLLKEASQHGELKIITNINKYDDLPSGLEYDIRATDLYNLMTSADLYENSEYVMKPYMGR